MPTSSRIVRPRLVLVTGTARAGTKYIAKVLQACGLRVGHEWTDRDGTASSFFAVNDEQGYPLSEWVAPRGRIAHQGERRADYDFKVVLHQVRHPLKVIASAAKIINGKNWRWIERHTSIPAHLRPPVLRAARYWMTWNALIDAQCPTYRYQLERIDEHWPVIQSLLGLTCPLPDTSRRTNSAGGYRKPMPLTWDDLYLLDPLIAARVRIQARRYGYDD